MYEKNITQLTPELLGAGPLEFNFPLTTSVTINTKVFGANRSDVTVGIVYGSITLWSGTMTQFAPTVKTPYTIIAGTTTIEEGCTFRLTIPTASQDGNVVCSGTLQVQGQDPVTFGTMVASWPLNSSTSE